VADFATARAADASGFADGIIREIVMQDKLLLALSAGVGIKFLRFLRRAMRRQNDRLSFAALEQRRTVRAWKDSSFARNRANLIEGAAVQTLLVI
jgi:hypothetical protein